MEKVLGKKYTLLYFLSILDFIITKQVIENGHGLEANPFLAWLVYSSGSIWAIAWFKMTMLLLLFVICNMYRTNELIQYKINIGMNLVLWFQGIVTVYGFLGWIITT